MTARDLKLILDSQLPPVPVNTAYDEAVVATSLRYLDSDAAKKSLETNLYWPKWDSPWWHMAILYEMGQASRIPSVTARWMLEAAKKQLLPVFFQSDIPTNRPLISDTPCPCSLGNMYQILNATGVDVDQALPWARSWFLRYQMPDGGMSCDEDAYRVEPPASSIVGTIAPLEAILLCTSREFTKEETEFLDRGAQCLIDRELRLGSKARHNVEEQEDEQDWLKPCFPRFYLYDVLRGLAFILKWAEKRQQPIPARAIAQVVGHLSEKFPDGKIHVERHAYEDIGTRIQSESGEWQRRLSATYFPLLMKVSEIGQVSPCLTTQWNSSKLLIRKLMTEGLIT